MRNEIIGGEQCLANRKFSMPTQASAFKPGLRSGKIPGGQRDQSPGRSLWSTGSWDSRFPLSDPLQNPRLHWRDFDPKSLGQLLRWVLRISLVLPAD